MRRPSKAAVLVAAPVLALVAAGIAYAASLTVTSTSLAAGTTVVAPCQTAGTINATYVTSDPTGTGFKVTGVNLSGIDDTGCAGKTVTVVLSDGSATNLGSGTATVSAPTASITLGTPVSESAATRLDIEIK